MHGRCLLFLILAGQVAGRVTYLFITSKGHFIIVYFLKILLYLVLNIKLIFVPCKYQKQQAPTIHTGSMER